jgi:MtrB/PioB family decaheme-associated outer membrane protein
MRIRLTFTIGVLALACASVSYAQDAPAPSGPTLFGLTGTVDFGARVTSTDGDAARYERYRDLRSGVFSSINLGQKNDRRLFGIRIEKVGYRDQSYAVDYNGGRTRASGSFDSIPLNYSYLTSSPWVESSTGVFSLSTVARQAVQNKVPGIVGVPQTVASLATTSIYRDLARPFDLQSRRDTLGGAYSYNATSALGFNVAFNSVKKSGNQPYGMSFSFNNANELPIPLDNRTNNMTAGLEYATSEGMIRVGWDASWFDNQIHEIIWDNPLRATDTNPYDASGYSNGNGPARGRMSMPPSNSMNVVSTTGLYKLPSHTTISGTVSFNAMNQNDALIPWTINSAIANPSVYASFPALASLPRATAEAKVHGLNGAFNFTSRPNTFFGLNMRYRFNDHRNLTPTFDAREYVRFDAVPEETGGETEHFNIRQNTFDLTGTFHLAQYTSLNLGYIFDDFNRTGRAFSDMRDYTFRASVDTVGSQLLTVRAAYDHTARIGSGFSEASLEDGGLQPGLRFYDEADRDRNRASLVFVANPASMVDVTLQLAAARDIYKGEGHDFGLLNNHNRSYNIGTSISPMTQLSVGANYGRDTYKSLQNSRNANPPGTDYGSWTDPNRTWFLDNDERVNNADVFVDLTQAIPHTDIRLNYEYSDSDNAFIHSGPRVQELLTNKALTVGDTPPCAAGLTSCFEALPNVTNTWHRVSADVRYFFTSRIGFAGTYSYEKFDVTDFATVDLTPGVPRIDYLGVINTGYGNRPYKGSTGFLRLLYTF